MRGGMGSQPTITWDDLRAIQAEVPAVRAAAPLSRTSTQAISESATWTTTVYGTTPDYFTIRNWTRRARRAAHGLRPGRRREERGDRPDRRREAVRQRRRPARPGDPHPQRAVQRRRRAGEEGPGRHGRGPGRRDLRADRRRSRRASRADSASSCAARSMSARVSTEAIEHGARADRRRCCASAIGWRPDAEDDFSTRQHGRDDRHADLGDPDADDAARVDRARVAVRRRHRRHEHHAGVA